jgi:hypothetical protein
VVVVTRDQAQGVGDAALSVSAGAVEVDEHLRPGVTRQRIADELLQEINPLLIVVKRP